MILLFSFSFSFIFGIYVEVIPNEATCFFDEVENSSLVLGNYSVYPLDAGLVDFMVQDYQHQNIIVKNYTFKGDFSFTSGLVMGDYMFCFSKSLNREGWKFFLMFIHF
jgi:hypothetical protein